MHTPRPCCAYYTTRRRGGLQHLRTTLSTPGADEATFTPFGAQAGRSGGRDEGASNV
jgi:hypothetical protein